MIIHTVRQGDTIYSIARRYGVPMDKIIADNQLQNPGRLVIGQTIVVLTDSIRHIVTAGQTLYSIARTYGTTVLSLIEANPDITDPTRIRIGQVIIVPVADRNLGPIIVNGYALPDISNQTLVQTLPYLTYISIFSYEVRADGSLNPIEDTAIIETARPAGVAPLMVITNTMAGSGFSSEIAHAILTNESVQDILLQNVLGVMQGENYAGLDIDFEYIFPEDRENYNNFLRKVVNFMHPLGYTVSTALAPKVSGTMTGLLYEAHDYPVHGELADHVILMTYEWGYIYGPPMAVAPLNEVERVLQYAVSVIPNQKILMGIPNYGYDWTLPYVRGSAARSLSNTAAVSLAGQVGANIMFDPVAQAPFFNYYDSSGRQHVVWFEDARSIEAKLLLVDKYNLGGVSYWTINSFFPQNWLVLDAMYDVTKVL